MKVLSSRQIREIDGYAIGKLKIPGVVLMENAGAGVCSVVLDLISRQRKKTSVLVVCGKGNNGGDGFVVSRHLAGHGVEVNTFLMGNPSELRGDALTNYLILKNYGQKIQHVSTARDYLKKFSEIKKPGIIVDAIFGTGLKNTVKGFYSDVIEHINKCGAKIVSVDVPSGLDSDRGVKLGAAIKADVTVTFGYPKLGLLLGESFDYVGDMFVKDISLPKGNKITQKFDTQLIDPSYVRSLFKPRRPDAHKGSHGHVGIIAGSREKSGAAKLSSVSCLRAGAGLVTLAVPQSSHDIIKSSLFNVMSLPLADDGRGKISSKAIKSVMKLSSDMDVMVIGPGLMKSKTVGDLILELIKNTDKPLVVDADGLNSIASRCRELKKVRSSVVFTPHPGEMARLMGVSSAAVQSDRLGSVKRFVAKHELTLVLKGFRTIIGFPDGSFYINPTGNPAMAAAGMGDVLCGVMSAYVAQERDFKKAVISSVFNHGLLGDLVSAERGDRGVLATDLINKMTDITKTLYPSRKLQKIEELS